MTPEEHHRGHRWHPTCARGHLPTCCLAFAMSGEPGECPGIEPDVSGPDDASASEALAWRAREHHREFLAHVARAIGRPLTVMEQNLAIAQAEQIGEL